METYCKIYYNKITSMIVRSIHLNSFYYLLCKINHIYENRHSSPSPFIQRALD